MSWVAVGVAGASAVMGHMNAQQQQKQKQAEMMANAEAIRYSPWTKMNPGMMGAGGTPSPMTGALQGGLGGFMQGQAIKSGMNKSATADASAKLDAENAAAKAQEDELMQGKYYGSGSEESALDPSVMQRKKPMIYGSGGSNIA